MKNKKTKIFTTLLSLCLLICTIFVAVGCGAPKIDGLKPETAFTLEYKEGKWETTENPTLKAGTEYYFTFTTTENSKPYYSTFAIYSYNETGKDTKLDWADFTCEVLNENLETEFSLPANPFGPNPEFAYSTTYYLKITVTEDLTIRIVV